MITGFQIDVTTEQMAQHLERKAKWHRERAAECEERLGQITRAEATLGRDMAEQIGMRRGTMLGMGMEPFTWTPAEFNKDEAKALLSIHTDRARYMDFLRGHLPLNETFRLNEEDLFKLEFMGEFHISNPQQIMSGVQVGLR